MKRIAIASVFLMSPLLLMAQPEQKKPLTQSRCHCFVDYQNIWTFEMVQSQDGKRVPILNIITFTPGDWELRPAQVHIFNNKNKEARVEKFSMDTGIAEEPYISNTLKVLGNGFVGVDLIGNYAEFAEPSKVSIDLGEQRFDLQPMDCLQFDMLAEQINKINFDSPKVKEDFDVLKIEPRGSKQPKPVASR